MVVIGRRYRFLYNSQYRRGAAALIDRGLREGPTMRDDRRRWPQRQKDREEKIGCNFDDLAVNLNTDEIPISGAERRQESSAKRTGVAGRCFPSINSTMESNEAVVVVGRRSLSFDSRARYRNSNTIVKALTRRYARIEYDVLMQKATGEGVRGSVARFSYISARGSLIIDF